MPIRTGGTEAPVLGLSQPAPPRRSGYRPPKPRARQIARRVAANRQQRVSPAQVNRVADRVAKARGNPNAPSPGAQVAAQGRGRPGPQLGGQLQRLVSAGAVEKPQAEETAKERQLLQWAYGKDWRKQIAGGRGNIRLARQSLAESPEDPLVRANYEALMGERKKLVDHALKLWSATQGSAA